MGPENLDPVHF